jgi:hypothetical protein
MTTISILNITQIMVIGTGSLVVVLMTSVIHHWVGEINRWWDPRWASLILTIPISIIIQAQFIDTLEPIHILIIIANIIFTYLASVGMNTIFGRRVEVLSEFEQQQSKGFDADENVPLIITSEETWRTRWFD